MGNVKSIKSEDDLYGELRKVKERKRNSFDLTTLNNKARPVSLPSSLQRTIPKIVVTPPLDRPHHHHPRSRNSMPSLTKLKKDKLKKMLVEKQFYTSKQYDKLSRSQIKRLLKENSFVI